MSRSKSAGCFHSGRRNGNHPSPSYQKCLFGAHRRLFIIICVTVSLSLSSQLPVNTPTHPTDLAGYFLFFFFLLPAGACPIRRLGHRRVRSKLTEQLFLKSTDNVLKCHSLIFWCLQKKTNPTLKKRETNPISTTVLCELLAWLVCC